MTPFRFRLARLMRVREIREELARSELLAAELALREAELALEGARGELRGAESELAHFQSLPAVVPGEIVAAQRTLPPLAQRIARRREQAATLAADSLRARHAWQAARIDVRVLEKLEERALTAHHAQERASEDKLTQEFIDRNGAASGRAPLELGVDA